MKNCKTASIRDPLPPNHCGPPSFDKLNRHPNPSQNHNPRNVGTQTQLNPEKGDKEALEVNEEFDRIRGSGRKGFLLVDLPLVTQNYFIRGNTPRQREFALFARETNMHNISHDFSLVAGRDY